MQREKLINPNLESHLEPAMTNLIFKSERSKLLGMRSFVKTRNFWSNEKVQSLNLRRRKNPYRH